MWFVYWWLHKHGISLLFVLRHLIWELFKIVSINCNLISLKDGLNNASCSLPSVPCKDTPNFGCSNTTTNGKGLCQCSDFPYAWDSSTFTCKCDHPKYVQSENTCGKKN